MANKLSDELQSVSQRSGTNTGGMRTEAQRASFSSNVRKDIASIVQQLNVVYKQLVQTLSSEDGLNALDFGISGNVIFTHINASAADAEAYWSADQNRVRTIKETIDVLLSEIARLENELQASLDVSEYDDTELRGLIAGNDLDLQQLALDTMGPDYTLDGDGLANLSYSVTQALDAIGVFFSGYVASGNTYTSSYPALSLSILLSQITIDTTLAQSVITGLPADLGYIRTFIGMDTSGPETPLYSAHGSVTFIADGTSLEQALAVLDAAAAAHAPRHESGGADEIDGDHLGMDFVPINYTRTTVPVALSVAHLSAHLAGIDLALASAGTQTLQTAYTAGGAGVAGDIQLANAKGAVKILDDASTPLTDVLSWWNASVAKAGSFGSAGVSLFGDTWYALEESTSDPSFTANTGKINCRPDADSGNTELWFRNEFASDPNAQLTRDGIVKELEIGHDYISAEHMVPDIPPAGSPPIVYLTNGSPKHMMGSRGFDTLAVEGVNFAFGVPVCEDGSLPTRFRVILYWTLSIGVGGVSRGVRWEVSASKSTGLESLADTSSLFPGWTPIGAISRVGLTDPTDHNLQFVESTPITPFTANNGLMQFQIQRDVVHVDDNWDDDVFLLGAKVVWYR